MQLNDFFEEGHSRTYYQEKEQYAITIEIILQVKSEKAMAPHSSVLAWRIPGMGEPGGLASMGSHRVGHD